MLKETKAEGGEQKQIQTPETLTPAQKYDERNLQGTSVFGTPEVLPEMSPEICKRVHRHGKSSLGYEGFLEQVAPFLGVSFHEGDDQDNSVYVRPTVPIAELPLAIREQFSILTRMPNTFPYLPLLEKKRKPKKKIAALTFADVAAALKEVSVSSVGIEDIERMRAATEWQKKDARAREIAIEEIKKQNRKTPNPKTVSDIIAYLKGRYEPLENANFLKVLGQHEWMHMNRRAPSHAIRLRGSAVPDDIIPTTPPPEIPLTARELPEAIDRILQYRRDILSHVVLLAKTRYPHLTLQILNEARWNKLNREKAPEEEFDRAWRIEIKLRALTAIGAYMVAETPGCWFPFLFVFYSDGQSIGKTAHCKAIAKYLSAGGTLRYASMLLDEIFSTDKKFHDIRSIAHVREASEKAEVDVHRGGTKGEKEQKESSLFKRTTDKTSHTARGAYKRDVSEWLVDWIYVITTNIKEFITDETGATRFIPNNYGYTDKKDGESKEEQMERIRTIGYSLEGLFFDTIHCLANARIAMEKDGGEVITVGSPPPLMKEGEPFGEDEPKEKPFSDDEMDIADPFADWKTPYFSEGAMERIADADDAEEAREKLAEEVDKITAGGTRIVPIAKEFGERLFGKLGRRKALRIIRDSTAYSYEEGRVYLRLRTPEEGLPKSAHHCIHEVDKDKSAKRVRALVPSGVGAMDAIDGIGNDKTIYTQKVLIRKQEEEESKSGTADP